VVNIVIHDLKHLEPTVYRYPPATVSTTIEQGVDDLIRNEFVPLTTQGCVIVSRGLATPGEVHKPSLVVRFFQSQTGDLLYKMLVKCRGVVTFDMLFCHGSPLVGYGKNRSKILLASGYWQE
jgi:hypothetical protein